MAYRNVVISSAVKITVKNEQLEVNGDARGSIPVEDIRTLLIESQASTISTYAMAFLAQNGVCVYFCDDKHLPCAILTPFCQNSRQKKQIEIIELTTVMNANGRFITIFCYCAAYVSSNYRITVI